MKFQNMIYIGLVLTAAVFLPLFTARAAVQNPGPAKLTLQASAGLHMPFVENKGQVADPAVAYVADARDGQMIYSLPGNKGNSRPAPEIREHIASSGKTIKVAGGDPRAAKVSYFQSLDQSPWAACALPVLWPTNTSTESGSRCRRATRSTKTPMALPWTSTIPPGNW